jgi:hypothetical protein
VVGGSQAESCVVTNQGTGTYLDIQVDLHWRPFVFPVPVSEWRFHWRTNEKPQLLSNALIRREVHFASLCVGRIMKRHENNLILTRVSLSLCKCKVPFLWFTSTDPAYVLRMLSAHITICTLYQITLIKHDTKKTTKKSKVELIKTNGYWKSNKAVYEN